MKVFLSSVRRGLETERDCLPGLLLAIGHEPVRFEDFTAQPVPSREACLRGVDASDAYLLLLGPHYGHVFPETDQSATHDEYMAALRRGIPRLVFRKTGVPFEPRQEEFARTVGEYGTGLFYATFESAVDLQPKVVSALRDLANAPSALVYEPLPRQVPIAWLDEWPGFASPDYTPVLELHVVSMSGATRSARLMTTIGDSIAMALRFSGALPATAGIEVRSTQGAVLALLPAPRRSYQEVGEGGLRGVRVDPGGQASVWIALPTDTMGSILNEQDVAQRLTGALRTLGTLGVLDGDRFALAVGTSKGTQISEGAVTGVARTSASFGFGRETPVRVEPDEVVSPAAFGQGAEEVARGLARALVERFRERR